MKSIQLKALANKDTILSEEGLVIWKENFAQKPLEDVPSLSVQVRVSWFHFIVHLLMTPDKFNWTLNMLKSPLWELLAEVEGTENSYIFHIPDKCIATKAPTCKQLMAQTHEQDTNKENEGDSSNQQDLDSLALLQPFGAENSKKRRGGKTPLVETEVRRSDRIKKDNAGFKRGSCSNNKCLPCNAAPQLLRNRWLKISQPHFARWLIRTWRKRSLRSPRGRWERTWLGCSHPMRTGRTPEVFR